MLALDPERFAGTEVFVSRAQELFAELRRARLAPGFEELLIPGEPEQRSEQRARELGIALPEATVDALRALGFRPCGETATAAP